jgi:hypothetical protein
MQFLSSYVHDYVHPLCASRLEYYSSSHNLIPLLILNNILFMLFSFPSADCSLRRLPLQSLFKHKTINHEILHLFIMLPRRSVCVAQRGVGMLLSSCWKKVFL